MSSKAAVKAAQAAEHELTLDQLLVFEEHKDDEEALATLTEVAKTYPRTLANKSSELRQKRRDAALLTAQQGKLAKSGTPIVTDEELAGDNLSAELTQLRPSPGHESGTPLTAAAHKNCPGNAVRIEFVGHGTDRKAVQVPLCRDFRTFGHAQLDAPKGVAAAKPAGKMTPEELAERRLTIKFNEQWPLSVEARRAFMLETFSGNTYPKGFRIHRRIAQLHIAAGYEFKRADERGHQLLRQCLASKAETGNGTQRQADHASLQKIIDGASEDRAAMITLGFWAFAVEENHSRHKNAWKARSAELVLLMTVLKELGKELTEVENYILGLDEQGNPLDGPAYPAATSKQVDSADSTGSAELAAA
ncbi:hypothetical protein [Lentzea flaviverrucosa]|uniref:Uncharacterized protein n=1 Tax=Lentzea flaviverrucosa TaxID=200379 RepID=A0A1H9EK98_9PSEU|nr:hypothetical protein [Lentzea flaviverrucosa]RDI35460.1 hypothetical protein DFR72_1011211 [Lentzea flaviverrucosa]SEQ26089.1 hypothetical protein SAMN05216195_1026 [Lentzea flaviverrucosa]